MKKYRIWLGRCMLDFGDPWAHARLMHMFTGGVLDFQFEPAFGGDGTLDGGFRQVPKSKAKYSNQVVKDLRVKV